MPTPDFSLPDGEAILNQMVQTVVTAEELEVEEEEEEAYEPLGPGRRPSFKILFVETRQPIDHLVERLYESASTSQRLRNLLDSYAIELAPKNGGYWLLVFKEREHGRPITFLVKVSESTWQVYSVETAAQVARTFRRMVEESDALDLAWIPREKLDRVVEEMAPLSVSGFTAKRHTRGSPKQVTVRVYGGDRNDLAMARKDFRSEPTTVYFKKTHSPEIALQGTIIADGELRIDRIAPNAIEDYRATKDGVSRRFIEQEYNRILGAYPEGISSELGSSVLRADNGELVGEVAKGFHALLFRIPSEYWKPELIASIKDVFATGLEGNFVGYEVNPGVLRTYDRVFGGAFTIRIDEETRTVVVDPLSGTTEKSMSALARVFLGRIEHSAKVEAVHQVF